MKTICYNIPLSQNTIKNINGTLPHLISNPNSSTKQTTHAPKYYKMLLPSIGDINYDYSKEDAIRNAWYRAYFFDVNNILEGKPRKLFSEISPSSDFIFKLERQGISNEIDWFNLKKDFNCISDNKLKQTVEYTASQYVVLKHQINTNFTDKKLETELSKLDKLFNTVKEKIATLFADKLDNFFEGNDIIVEKEKIYQSVLNSFDRKINNYSKYIEINKNYAGIEGTPDEWLKNDANFMASQLRKITTFDKNIRSQNNYYSLDELDAVQYMVMEIKTYQYQFNVSSKFGIPNSEQEIGLILSDLALKIRLFVNQSNISTNFKNALTQSVHDCIDKSIIALDAALKEKRTYSLIPSDNKGFAPLNRKDIYAVIDKVINTYNKTLDTSKSIKEGAVYATNEYNKNRNDSGEIYRYKGNAFKNFYKIQNKHDNMLKLIFPETYKKQSSFLEIIDSFNDFIDYFHFHASNKINSSEILIYT